MTEATDWRLEWRTLLFAAIFFPLLVGLGFWQLAREAEKRDILAQYDARRAQAPVPLRMTTALQDFTPVLIVGEYDPARYWLLDNRINNGRYGVEVVALFHLLDGGAVLVNRGWIAADAGRRSLPQVSVPGGVIRAEATVQPISARGLVDEERGQRAWPRRVQWLAVDDAATMIDEVLLPRLLKLRADEPGALVVSAPAVVNMPPEKHRAYAVQWFALAATLLGLVLWRARFAGPTHLTDE